MSTFTVLTHYSPSYDPVAAITLPGREAYCHRHGYRHVIQRGPYHDAGLYYAIDRLYLLLDDMRADSALSDTHQTECENHFYWVVNIPTIITNHTIKLESFVDDTHDFFIHRDVNALNAGSFIVRNSEWGRRWVQFIIDDTKTHRHEWFENFSILRHAETDAWKDKVKVVPHPGFNSYEYQRGYSMSPDTPGQWKPGHFVLALPGMDIDKRLGFLRSDWLQSSIIT